jgi:hypothetical protein
VDSVVGSHCLCVVSFLDLDSAYSSCSSRSYAEPPFEFALALHLPLRSTFHPLSLYRFTMSQSPSAVDRGQRVRRWAKKLGVAARGLVNAPVVGGAVEVVGEVIGALEVRAIE